MAKRGYDVPGPWDDRNNLSGDWKARWKAEEAALDALLDHSENLPEGEVVGGILMFPIADGQAIYRVEKARPLTLAHVPFGDAWHIPEAHMRGLTLADVKQRIHRKGIFGRVRMSP